MKKLFTLLLTCFSLITLLAQEQVLFVPPGPVGTLNDVIAKDLGPDGQRIPGRVYELQRGAPYLINAAILNAGFPLHIRARAGAGERPLIMYSVPTGGSALEDLFLARGELKLEGLNLYGRDNLAGFIRTGVRMDATGLKATLNDCVIQEFSQTAIRGNADNLRLFMTNCVVNRIGKPDDPDNGRVYDDRNSTDTLVMENNCFYNITSRVIRDGNTSKIVNYARINQNTVCNVLQRGFEIGRIKDLIFTNNLMINTYAFGRTLGGSPAYYINIDSTAGRNWTIANNNFFLTPQVRSFITGLRRPNGDTLFPLPFPAFAFPPIARVTSNLFQEELTLRNGPVAPIDQIRANALDTVSGSTVPGAAPWNHAGINRDPIFSQLGSPTIDRHSAFHDFGYPSNTRSATGGTSGQRLGSFLFSITVSNRELRFTEEVLAYPNPTTDRLYLQSKDEQPFRYVQIFDLQGRMVQHWPNLELMLVDLDLSALPAGTYLVKAGKADDKLSVKPIQKQ